MPYVKKNYEVIGILKRVENLNVKFMLGRQIKYFPDRHRGLKLHCNVTTTYLETQGLPYVFGERSTVT